MLRRRTLFAFATLGLAVTALAAHPRVARSASLPPHPPLRILVVSDEVNPHGLTPAELTQPGDLSAALLAPFNGLDVEAADEIATDDLPLATAALGLAVSDPLAYDVLIYFAHRIPTGPNGAQQQSDFDAAVEAFLVAGGGVVAFHHGNYVAAGKAGILDLIGGQASAVSWQPVEGQRVINVAPGHFVTGQGLVYPGGASYADASLGIPPGLYDAFVSAPDERYPVFDLTADPAHVEILFASDYEDMGSTHLLAFAHQRPGWQGRVVALQPGEYQPTALDDTNGPLFQILANALLYSAGLEPGGALPATGPFARGVTAAILLAAGGLAAALAARPRARATSPAGRRLR